MGLIDDQSVLCTALSVGRELLFFSVWKKGKHFFTLSLDTPVG